MWAVLLLVNAVFATDISRNTNFTIKHVESCPDVGYYFRRELAPNSLNTGPCYLCFCQNDGIAACWQRDNRRCDSESYHHHGVGRRDTRVRRGTGFGDIFFRDAARDIFNKRLPEQCKPFESSFSDGCPPVDWCIGCTVCDCDANGHWDCHVLSFCPESTTKKGPAKKRRGPYSRTMIRKSPTNVTNKQNTKKPPKPKLKPKPKPKTKVIKKVIKITVDKRIKRQPTQESKQTKFKKVIRRRLRASKKVAKKNVTARYPIELKNTRTNQIVLPSTTKLSQAVVRKVMAAVQKLLRYDVKKGNSSRLLKAVERKPLQTNKHVTIRNDKKANVKTSKVDVKRNKIQAKSSAQGSKEQRKVGRNKREVDIDEIRIEVSTKRSVTEDNMTTPLDDAVDAATENLIQNNVSTNNINNLYKNNVIMYKPKIMSTSAMTTISDGVSYNYFIINNTSDYINTSTRQPNTYNDIFVQVNTSQDIFKLTATEKSTNFSMNALNGQENKKLIQENMISLESMSDVDSLKLSRWSPIKQLKRKYKGNYFKIDLVNSTNDDQIFKSINNTIGYQTIALKKKIHSKNIKRKIGLSKKFNLEKIVTPYKRGKDKKVAIDKSYVRRASGNIADLQNMLKKLLKEYGKNNTIKVKPKAKKINVIKYVRKFFKRIFHKDTKKVLMSKHDASFNKHRIIETLCEIFGPCKVSPKHKILLKAKLESLSSETTKILKTIIIIKGLLHLVERPKYNKNIEVYSNTQKSQFNDDIEKLNAILRGTYNVQKPMQQQTQATQIDYIKKNTQEFIKCVGKFAHLLNEIIAILTVHKNKKADSEIFSRVLRASKEDKNYTADAFKNMKSLLFKYDLKQNTFVRRMHEALSIFESKLNKKKREKVTMEKELNNMASISNFSMNIITNLRKLTHLAQTLNTRRKREVVREDDTVQYLLTLMEYLLKQNYPLDATPVNDGIDLLMEAIKNAPDIKSIKKKVLDYTPATTPAIRTIPVDTSNLNDDSSSDSNKFSKDVTRTKAAYISKLDDPKFVEQEEEDRDDDEKYVYERKASEMTTKAHLNAVEITEKVEIVNFEPVTEVTTVVEKLNENYQVDEKEPVDKVVGGGGGVENNRRYEVFVEDMDDDVILSTRTSTAATEAITSPMDITTETKFKFFMDDSTRSTNARKKSKLDWLEENYAEEIKEFKNENATTTTQTHKTTKITNKSPEENISSITKELKDEKKSKPKINADEVMFRKQMDLLNSLDYGTEKIDIENSESKDTPSDDRYSGDAFPSYYV